MNNLFPPWARWMVLSPYTGWIWLEDLIQCLGQWGRAQSGHVGLRGWGRGVRELLRPNPAAWRERGHGLAPKSLGIWHWGWVAVLMATAPMPPNLTPWGAPWARCYDSMGHIWPMSWRLSTPDLHHSLLLLVFLEVSQLSNRADSINLWDLKQAHPRKAF